MNLVTTDGLTVIMIEMARQKENRGNVIQRSPFLSPIGKTMGRDETAAGRGKMGQHPDQ